MVKTAQKEQPGNIMAKLPTLNKILQENFPNSPDIQRLAGIINQFMLETVKAFDKQLTILDNFDAEIKTLTIDGVFPIYIAWGRSVRPSIGLLGAIRRIDGTYFTLSEAVSVDWEFDASGKIKLKGLPGLSSSSVDKYEVKLVFLVG